MSQAQQQSVGSPQSSIAMQNQVVHVRENSDQDMEALFKVLETANALNSTPWKNKKMPDSFFRPPEPQGSNNSSTDNLNQFPGLTSQNSHMPIAHVRSQSLPASMPQSFSAAPLQPQHMRTQSYDISQDDNLGPLPPGWDKGGQRYFNPST